MKKLSICFVIVFLLISTVVSAGDLPESILYEDGAQLFVGKVEETLILRYSTKPQNEFEIQYIDIIPTKVFKGDVEAGVSRRYTDCRLIQTVPEKDREYLFAYIGENFFYMWEIKSLDGEKIELQNPNSMDERLEEYINDGTVEAAEIKRKNLGRKISFSEFLNSNAKTTEKVTFTFDNKNYDVDKDDFFKLADSILITDVKDGIMKDTYPNTEEMLSGLIYINIFHIGSDNPQSYAAISQYGEVDAYLSVMSRLPGVDFQMATEDLQKLYNLMPKEAQKSMPVLAVAQPANNYFNCWIYTAGLLVAIIAIIVFIVWRKRRIK